MLGRSNTQQRGSGSAASSSHDASLLGATTLAGNRVFDDDGRLVGVVEEIVIDVRTGCIRHAVLAIGGIFGFGRRRVAVPWSALKPDARYRRCVINVNQMQLTAVPVPDDDPWLQRRVTTRSRVHVGGRVNLLGARPT